MVTTRRYERKLCRQSGNRPRRTSFIGGAYAGDARTVPSIPDAARISDSKGRETLSTRGPNVPVRLIGQAQPVTDAGFSDDVRRALGVLFELLA
jgi:hypothetical protein